MAQCREVKVQSHACSSIPPSIEDTATTINLVSAQVTPTSRLFELQYRSSAEMALSSNVAPHNGSHTAKVPASTHQISH